MTPLALGIPSPLEMVVILVVFGGPVVLILLAISRGKRRATIQAAFPVAYPDGPGATASPAWIKPPMPIVKSSSRPIAVPTRRSKRNSMGLWSQK